MALDKSKVDAELGRKVLGYLESKKVHTPMIKSDLTYDQKFDIVKQSFTSIMTALDLDLQDDSLMETPDRVAKMYLNEIFWGLKPENFPKITTVENKIQYDEMILEKDIRVSSNCEHHFVIIDGFAHVAYIPKQKVLGLSKLNRIVEYFAKRPQIQERLTAQVFYCLEYLLETSDIAVMINAAHYCVKSRGVEDTNSSTVTSKLGGCFLSEPECRNEFMMLCKN